MHYLIAALTLLALTGPAVADSPYKNLAFALKQQKMTDDLRSHCQIPVSVADEALRQRFLAEPQQSDLLLSAAQALKANDEPRYLSLLAKIECPDAQAR
ncbi:YicS family protein [Pantoea sp. FN060301]|uniref:YicS family protein n=1 Tax=Pantoea sp. FN060301 TaxID=3420380 RepID=UPI003D16FD81